MQLFGVGHGLFAGAHVGLGHNFQQRRARAVQVNAGLADEVFMQGFACVFFQVRAHQADRFFLLIQEELNRTTHHHRDLKLTDLVALGQVGVEVVFAREDAARRDSRANRQTELNGPFHRTLVHHRQRARQRQIHRAGLGIGLGSKRGRCATEDFAVGRELGVSFEADDDFVALY